MQQQTEFLSKELSELRDGEGPTVQGRAENNVAALGREHQLTTLVDLHRVALAVLNARCKVNE